MLLHISQVKKTETIKSKSSKLKSIIKIFHILKDQ